MRLFTAIELPTPLLSRLERLTSALRPEALIKWSPLDNLHITTKFIGEWPEGRLEELNGVLSRVGSPEPIKLEIRGLGWYPNEKSPRVLWAGVHGGDALLRHARLVEECLQEIGITAENRSFSPHLTLARIKNPVPLDALRRKVNELEPALIGEFTVAHFALFRSQAGSNASIYSKLREFKTEAAFAAS